ncbi:hypothetical protein ACI2JI_09410 [Enterobacter cancerogenus]|uniref:hypothetical protein n=1 Tax=Enterobacter cancerogenus TaxID=69218 RepID=UPI00384CC343
MLKDIYDYIKTRNGEDANFLSAVQKQYQRNAVLSNSVIRGLLAPLFTYLKPKCTVQYIFFSNKYSDILLNLPQGSSCVVGGPKQLGYCLKNKIPLISNMKYWSVLNNGLSFLTESKDLKHVHDNFLEEIQPYITSETVFIVDNDSMPMQRAIIDVMRELKVKICLIQDGLFQSLTPANHIHGWKSDIILCYDEYQKKILENKIKTAAKVHVVGFYKSIKFGKISADARKVCFLGQPWYKYGSDYQRRYLEIYKLVNQVLSEKSVSFKPHPWEKDAPYISEMENIYKGTMEQALNDFDCFISLTSTALFEATIAGKLSIQILDKMFECDDFQQYGYAYSATMEDVKKGFLNEIIEYEPINGDSACGDKPQQYIDYFLMKKYMLD